MRKFHFAFSIKLLLASTTIAYASQPDVRFELVEEMTACVAKLDVAHDAGHSVDGLATMRVSTKGALKFLLGDEGMDADRRRAVRDISAEFEDELQLSPMNARSKVRALTQQCRDLVYEAEDVRVDWVAAKKADAERKEALEAEARRKEAEAAMRATIAADREHALELAKIHAENERLRIQTNGELSAKEMALGLEEKKIDAATTIEVTKVTAQTDRLAIEKSAEIAIDKNKAAVESTRIVAGAATDIAKVDAEAKIAVTGKIAEMTTTMESAALEREKVRAASNAAIASDLAKTIEKVETKKADAAVEVAKHEAAASVETAHAIAQAHIATTGRSEEQTVVMEGALECGGFYAVMVKNAPQNQRSGISALATVMFEVARDSGADDQMISDAPKNMLQKIKATAASGRKALQSELVSIKERCTTMSDVAKF
ncbi:hypothetical protein AB3G45_17620 [Shinella sp. S4-D37]|uniref:hypothetical protein n=1 Tax=Shinella sp. S4-D37 TaxID=3161999 RepID=UPI00346724E7